jgi:hypothetical protein
MEHHLNTEDADKYGPIAAIVLNNIKYWICKNKANHRHFHDGRTWTYNSIEAFHKIFHYLSIWQIRRVLDKLVKAGVLLKGNFNKSKYDRTLWYALADEEAALKDFPPILQKPQTEGGETANGIRKNHKPIPNPKPNKNPDRNNRVGISPNEILGLDLKIAEGRNQFCEQIEKVFHLTKNEQTTFSRITQHLVDLCQRGKAEPTIFESAIRWAKESRKSAARNKKALFVAKVKRETGFKAQARLLSRKRKDYPVF